MRLIDSMTAISSEAREGDRDKPESRLRHRVVPPQSSHFATRQMKMT